MAVLGSFDSGYLALSLLDLEFLALEIWDLEFWDLEIAERHGLDPALSFDDAVQLRGAMLAFAQAELEAGETVAQRFEEGFEEGFEEELEGKQFEVQAHPKSVGILGVVAAHKPAVEALFFDWIVIEAQVDVQRSARDDIYFAVQSGSNFQQCVSTLFAERYGLLIALLVQPYALGLFVLPLPYWKWLPPASPREPYSSRLA